MYANIGWRAWLAEHIIGMVRRIYDHTPVWNVPHDIEAPLYLALHKLIMVENLNPLEYLLLTLTVAGMFHLIESAQAKREKMGQN